SLDLSKPIDLNIHDAANMDEILETLAPYVVEN
ncbi:MAG TPA: HPr family phosphocarrier protein, partial [Candidatus Copromonas avistercoris]|nr:HPr family phosphocarrier protein [Candidatus Copromonas avistercoris]